MSGTVFVYTFELYTYANFQDITFAENSGKIFELFPRNLRKVFFLKIGIHSANSTYSLPRPELCNNYIEGSPYRLHRQGTIFYQNDR